MSAVLADLSNIVYSGYDTAAGGLDATRQLAWHTTMRAAPATVSDHFAELFQRQRSGLVNGINQYDGAIQANRNSCRARQWLYCNELSPPTRGSDHGTHPA